MCSHLTEERYRIDHRRRVIRRGGQALPELVAQSNHVVRQIQTVVLKHCRYSGNAVQSAGVLNRNNLEWDTPEETNTNYYKIEMPRLMVNPFKLFTAREITPSSEYARVVFVMVISEQFSKFTYSSCGE